VGPTLDPGAIAVGDRAADRYVRNCGRGDAHYEGEIASRGRT
jgi:hypothetical protein